ncbi:hypothetical protein BH10BAC6_BH10BAC6_03280 [soil metagenome]
MSCHNSPALQVAAKTFLACTIDATTPMNLKTVFVLTITMALLFSCKDYGESIFNDENYQDTIGQNIGGILIREIHFNDHIHNWQNDIAYSYKDETNRTSNIGIGTYYCEEPLKNEQLIRCGKWILFKTSGDRDRDYLFVFDNDTKEWVKYEISPRTIEQTDLWKEQNIDSKLGNWDTVSKVDNIDAKGTVTVLYTYAKRNRIFSFMTGERQIIYRLNMQTGRPEMISVTAM